MSERQFEGKPILMAGEIISFSLRPNDNVKDLHHVLWSARIALMNFKQRLMYYEAKNPWPIGKCNHRWLFRIHSRNLGFGVFDRMTYGFTGIREKFGHEYLFEEYHYDTGAPHGTVNPIEPLEPLPESIDLKAGIDEPLFQWLKEKEKQYGKQTEDDGFV